MTRFCNGTIKIVDTAVVAPSLAWSEIRRVDGFGVLHLGRRRFLIPVDVIIFIDARNVHIDQTSGRIAEAEAVVSDPALAVVPGPTYWEGMYRWYGYPPYWARGYSYWRRYD